MIGRNYLLKKPAEPSKPKLFLDTRIVPLAVNVAGGMEVALVRAAARAGLRPATIMAGVTSLLSYAAFRWLRSRRAGRRARAGTRP